MCCTAEKKKKKKKEVHKGQRSVLTWISAAKRKTQDVFIYIFWNQKDIKKYIYINLKATWEYSHHDVYLTHAVRERDIWPARVRVCVISVREWYTDRVSVCPCVHAHPTFWLMMLQIGGGEGISHNATLLVPNGPDGRTDTEEEGGGIYGDGCCS